jgi:hypothetical protein
MIHGKDSDELNSIIEKCVKLLENPEFTGTTFDGERNAWVTEPPVPPAMSMSSVYYRICHVDSDTMKSGTGSWQVAGKPDLTLPIPYDMHLDVSGEKLVLRFAVRNGGTVPVNGIPVEFKWRIVSDDERGRVGGWLPFEPVSRDTIDLEPLETDFAEIPFELPRGNYSITACIDPDDIVEETSEQNNSNLGRPVRLVYDHFMVTPGEGSAGYVKSPDGNLICSIPPGFVSSPTSVAINSADIPDPVEQPDLKNVVPADEGSPRAWIVTFADSTLLTGNGEISLRMVYSTKDSLNDNQDEIAPYMWRPGVKKWLRKPVMSDMADSSGTVEFTAGEPGLFAMFVSGDLTGPHVELNVEGQHYIEDCYVSATPTITALVQDENGVDTTASSMSLELDGVPVSSSGLSVTWSSESPNWMTVRFEPELGKGTNHTIRLTAKDVNLNEGSGELRFNVASGLDIEKYANYPNPVTGERTTFIFYVTAWADEVSLSIYTSSGRLIRCFSTSKGDRDLQPVDYSEKTWDLKDEEGNPVANGVYFYKIRAVAGKEKVVMTSHVSTSDWFSSLLDRFDELPKGARIALMVLGFIMFWPIGLAILAYLIWSGQMGSGHFPGKVKKELDIRLRFR